jgi:membrane associated rhomboid family serine protease
MWSVNTWIIVICVAVFAIDGLLPWTYPSAGGPILVEGVNRLPATAVTDKTPVVAQITYQDSHGRRATRQVPAKRILDGPSGPQIGWQPVMQMRPLQAFLHFSSYELIFRGGFWRPVGFQFLHANLTHLLFNMIGLYFFGPLIERHLGSKRYLAFYLLCGICGALMYGVLNLGGWMASLFLGPNAVVPGLLFNDMSTPLIGASAGVFGVLMAGAYIAPNATVLVFFFLPMRLRTLAYVLVGIAAFTVLTSGGNAGGEAGHLGGALAGFYFIRHPRHLHGFFDFVGWADPTSRHYRHRGAEARARAMARSPVGSREGGPDRETVDRILDKVQASGLGSLTDKERRILREASER